jgi:hypothetical protein
MGLLSINDPTLTAREHSPFSDKYRWHFSGLYHVRDRELQEGAQPGYFMNISLLKGTESRMDKGLRAIMRHI